MNRIKLFLLFCLLLQVLTLGAQQKREFRGAWIQCVNGQFKGLSRDEMQRQLTQQLNELQRDGVNAIIFQVRAECDALYDSPLEPWSRYLTGQQGVAPNPFWDPLQWMVTECHRRGMELHAWINPFRAKTKGTQELAANHVAIKNPGGMFAYDGQLIMNPGQPANRTYICKVAADIVRRYDVDGFHIDDYFYPYPVAGLAIPDDNAYAAYGNGIKDRGDWRRYNVNLFIKELSDSIHAVKPWVKFGVSPFGIYRNQTSWAGGSATKGLQNYDDLYADVLLWVNKGWTDYCVPQLYWQVGHPTADYKELITWWNRNAGNRPLYIGESVDNTVRNADPQNPNSHQLPLKRKLQGQMRNVCGTVLWYAKNFCDNVGSYATLMRENYWKYPALQPRMPFLDDKAPKKPKRVKPVWTNDGYVLFWQAPKAKKWGDEAVRYVVYRFEKGEKVALDDASKIAAITTNCYYKLPYEDGQHKWAYLVTAVDRMSNESKAVKKKISL